MYRSSTLTMALAAVASQAGAAAPRRAATPTARRAAPRSDPIRDLVGAIAINTARRGEDLHAACERAEFKTLAWALSAVRSKVTVAKSEYETQLEFDARRRKVEDTLNQQGDLIVCQPLDDNEDAPFAYDAEREAFAGSFLAHQNVWRDVRRTGRYVSRTRMGVRATVTSSVDVEYDVDFGTALAAARPACLAGSYRYEYLAPVARAQAPIVKARGYLVFTGRLVAPFVDSDDTPGSPTLDQPHDVYKRDIVVHFEPKTAAIVGPGGLRPWQCALTR